MRRTGRRHASDYLEENEKMNEEYIEFGEELFAEDAENEVVPENEELYEEEEKSSAARVWKKIGKIALIILVLIALFFISMKVTEIFLDRNQEPDSYGTEVPAYGEDEYDENSDIPIIEETDEKEENINTEEEEEKKTSTEEKNESKSSDNEKTETKKGEVKKEEPKKEETKKPESSAPNEKPQEPSTQEPAAPSTTETPSTPSKPIITPGNPAA